ncbi:MAG: TolC family protein [Deltaproteobacteria bacterium]|nr:TolC family protein [Deltaproteobacteria bacterium]
MPAQRALRVCVACSVVGLWSPASAEQLELSAAVRQTLDANLDLAAQRRTLAASREQVELARASLLPQLTVAARAQRLDDDRSDAERGETTQDSITFAGKVTQLLYDESTRAEVTIQKRLYGEQGEQFESFRLEVIQDAASAFLELARAEAELGIQQNNRDLTARNLETSRARIAAGWSSDREVLRWESQLATNDTSVVDARTRALLNRFELNRVRNRIAEAPIQPRPVALERYGFVYARPGIIDAIAEPAGDRRLRDLLVQLGMERSPVLAAVDFALAAEERKLMANQRSLWAPSFGLDAQVNHVASEGSGGAEDFDKTEWTLGANVAFPLWQGGAKFAELRQTRETLSGLRIERRSAAQTVDQEIRAGFARASGSHAALLLARKQEAAAGRNYALANDSYVLGVASVLSLLDAQSQLLLALNSVVDAQYDFFQDLVAPERAIALYPFLEPATEIRDLEDRIERALLGP